MLSSVLARRPQAAPSYNVELITAPDLPRVREAWADLFDRSAECNVFYGPDLLEPLVSGPLGDTSFRVLLAWRETESGRRLAGFMPLRCAMTPFAPVRGFKHHYVIGSAPLLDETEPVEAAKALMDGLASLRSRPLLVMDDVRLDWPAWTAFVQAANETGRVLQEEDVTQRAAVAPSSGASHLKGKIAQNLRRSGARLSEKGAWSVSMSDDIKEARAALEALLAVEASGWKGEAGTALASKPETAAFARAAFDPANQRPKPRFSVLALDGKPIAVSMHLIARDNAANLKCAYDETFSAFSPGVLLDAAVMDDLKREAFAPMLDSVALPGHPVERLWPERLRCGWVAVACDPSMGAAEFHSRLSVERMQRSMRRIAANVYHSTMPALRKVVGRS